MLKFEVVSTIISDVHFSRFSTVEHVPTIQSFLCDVINYEQKIREKKNIFTPLLVHFVSNTLCRCLQHPHLRKQIFKHVEGLKACQNQPLGVDSNVESK